MKTLIRSICLICMFNLISAQTQWVRYGDAPVLELGPAGSWEDYYVTTPYIIEVDDTLRMWYGGCEDANENYAIGYAWSIDGITWTKWDNNPVLEVGIAGSWDAKRVAWPEVQYQNGEYIMWYSGKGNANPYDRLKIGVARASDPVHWVKDTNNPVFEGSADGSWDDKHVVVFCVEYDGSEYTMWYSGRQGGGHYQIGRSFSADGVTNWLRDSSNPIIPNGAVGEWDYQETWGSSLYRVGELVEIFYSGVGTGVAIGLATSSDGDNFTKYPGNPIFEHGSSGSWDDYSVSYPSVGYDSTSTTFRIWYVGNDGQHAQIGYATSTHTDVAGGPVSGTWTLANSPYRIQGEITIPNDSTLTIEPGVRVEFQGHYTLNVQGRLIAIGTEADLITFTVRDTTGFSNNASSEGVWGGIRFDGTPATNDSSFLAYCNLEFAKTFSGSEAPFGKPGGALYISNFSKLRVEHCLIQHNRAIGNVTGYAGIGAGIAIVGYSNPEIVNNLIQFNTSTHLSDNTGSTGGGVFVYNHCDPFISGNTIRNNRTSDTGGGLSIWEDCAPVVSNNLIVNNKALGNDGTGGWGGGVAIGWDARPVFINNTIVNNSAGGAGGSFWFNGGDAVFINTIIAGNQDIVEPFKGHEIGTWNMSGYTFDFHNSCLEGGETGIHWGSGIGSVNFVESIAVDPDLLFNYGLKTTSPCISAGTMSCEISGTTYNAPSYDLAGNDRPMPAGTNPDMGAFEDQYILGINDETIMPAKFALYQNYPNPFNPTTTIQYELPQRSDVQITIYDLLGRKVTSLVSETQEAGYKSIQWDATNVPSGMYFYKIKAGDFVQTRKMILLK